MAAIHGSCSSGIAMSAIRANDRTTTWRVTGRAFTLVVTLVEAANGGASQATVETHSSRSSASKTGRGSVCGSGTGTGHPRANERASNHSMSPGLHRTSCEAGAGHDPVHIRQPAPQSLTFPLGCAGDHLS